MRAFGATNEKGTCLWCGSKLRMDWHVEYERGERVHRKVTLCCKVPFEEDSRDEYGGVCSDCGQVVSASYRKRKEVCRRPLFDKPGYQGNGQFCTMTCGYLFGLSMAKGGQRLVVFKVGGEV